jgi:nucleoside-triphosphatase
VRAKRFGELRWWDMTPSKDLGRRVKNILLTGRPGVGKTTVIEFVVREFENKAGGFVTGEIREGRVRKGFRITSLDGNTATLAHIKSDSPVRVGKYGVSTSAFESVALPALRRALEQKQIVVVDEIGKMEMASEKFRRAVVEVLDSSCAVIATVPQHSNPFTDEIKRRGDVAVFEVTSKNRNSLPTIIKRSLQEICSA